MSLSSLKRAIKQLSSPQGHPGSGAFLVSPVLLLSVSLIMPGGAWGSGGLWEIMDQFITNVWAG